MAAINSVQNQNIGALVKYHRRKASLTQIELAQLAGVGKSTVYEIEIGKQVVQFDKLTAILRVLNIDIHFDSPLMSDYEKSTDTAVQQESR